MKGQAERSALLKLFGGKAPIRGALVWGKLCLLCFVQWNELFMNSTYLEYQSKYYLPVYKCTPLTYIFEAS